MNNQEPKNGCFFARDNNDCAVIIEWHKTNILAPQLAEFKKEVSDLASQVTASSETEFLKCFPAAISSGGFLKSCEPLFAQGVERVNWIAIEQKLQESIKQFYRADLSLFGQEIINKLMQDVYFFALVRDQTTSQLLGFIMSSITPALPEGDIKLINLVIVPQEHGTGLEELLLSSILYVLPHIKRIFTMVRPTNNNMLQELATCGFTKDKKPMQDPHHPIDNKYLVVLEYKTDVSDVLQKTSARLS